MPEILKWSLHTLNNDNLYKMLKRTVIKTLLTEGKAGEKAIVKGWVRTKRGSKAVNFIALNDGSTINNIQVVADVEKIGEDILKSVSTGAALAVKGEIVASQGSGQSIELVADQVTVLGEANPEEYPIQPKKHSMEFLSMQKQTT